jgi:Zn-dependent protease
MANEIVLVVFYAFILVYSIIIHEVAHGVAALKLGDGTAKYAGRLNLNPLVHIDLWGSIVMPLLMLLMTNFRFAFGWAKPVPYNPYNLKNQKWGPALVALGGPVSNISLALIAALIGKMITIPLAVKADIIYNVKFANWEALSSLIAGSFGSIVFTLCAIVILWNTLLAFFNLIPIPPLDGSKILFSIINVKTETMIMFEQFGFVLLLLVIFLFSVPLGIFLNAMMNLFFSFAL